MKKKYFSKILIIALFFGVNNSWGQLSITSLGTDFTIDFDSTVAGVNNDKFNGTGLNVTPATGQLDGDAWAITGFSDGTHNFGDTHQSGDFSRGTTNGAVNTGGLYSVAIPIENFSLGVQPIGSDFTSGTITLKIDNNTGSTIVEVNVSYNVYIYNDQERSNNFNFSYSTDNSTYNTISALDITSPEVSDASPSWVPTGKFRNISGLSIPNGGSFYIRWTGADVSGSGSRDQFALDDITIKMSPTVLDTENLDTKFNVGVYPNPVTNGKLFIKSNSSKIKNIEIYNVLGRKVLTDKVTSNQEINVSNLSSGVYVLRIKEGDKSQTKKIVIK